MTCRCWSLAVMHLKVRHLGHRQQLGTIDLQPSATCPPEQVRRTGPEEVFVVLTFDPFRDLDRLAGQMLGASPSTAATMAMPLDLYRSGDHFVLHCDLAGVDPGSVSVGVDNRVLTIRAERSPRTDDDVQWIRRERPTGTFERRLTVGDGLDLDRVEATWQEGEIGRASCR